MASKDQVTSLDVSPGVGIVVGWNKSFKSTCSCQIKSGWPVRCYVPCNSSRYVYFCVVLDCRYMYYRCCCSIRVRAFIIGETVTSNRSTTFT